MAAAAAGARRWIVTVSSPSAARISRKEQVGLGTGGGGPVDGIRIRNAMCWSGEERGDGAPTFAGGIVVEATGVAADSTAAVDTLGNAAAPYLHVVALAANAAVEDTEDIVTYAPPEDPADVGEFFVQRHSQPRSPAASVRDVDADALVTLIQHLVGHPHEERLHRAMAHYRMALSHLDPLNRLLAAESLWMAVENLSQVVLDRLRVERGLPPTPTGKHLLAEALGYRARPAPRQHIVVTALLRLRLLSPKALRRDNSHLGRLDAHVRREVIFGGDKACYAALKEASDGFEHGFLDFAQVRSKSEVADRAFTLVRRAILSEIGVPSNSPLFDRRYDAPLAAWRPVFEAAATYRDTAAAPFPSEGPSIVHRPWPDPPGLPLVPLMKRVVDDDDGVRHITLEVNGTAELTETQRAELVSASWALPGAPDKKPLSSEFCARLNGNVVAEILSVPPAGSAE